MRRYIITAGALVALLGPATGVFAAGNVTGGGHAATVTHTPAKAGLKGVRRVVSRGAVQFQLLAVRAESPTSKPDWNLTGQGLSSITAPGKVIFSAYVNITKSPPNQTILATESISVAGTVIKRFSDKYSLQGNGVGEYRLKSGPWDFSKPAAGHTFTYTIKVTIAGASEASSTTLAVQ